MLRHSNILLRKHVQISSLEATENKIDKQIFSYREDPVSKRMVMSSCLCDFLDWIFFFLRTLGLLQEERSISQVWECVCKFTITRWNNFHRDVVICYSKLCKNVYFCIHYLCKLTGKQKITDPKKTLTTKTTSLSLLDFLNYRKWKQHLRLH